MEKTLSSLIGLKLLLRISTFYTPSKLLTYKEPFAGNSDLTTQSML